MSAAIAVVLLGVASLGILFVALLILPPTKSGSTQKAADAAETMPAGMGTLLKDPSLGGKCALVPSRKKACGTANCRKLPQCPTYQWTGTLFHVGKLPQATGITNKSASISNGLDPQGILDIVNKLRAQVGSAPVVWDDRLACAAAAWLPLTNYDTCPHGAAPGFNYFAQVIAPSTSLTQTPMQVAQYGIEILFFQQEKAIADKQQIAPNAKKAEAAGWKRGTIKDPLNDDIGHYIIMCSDEVHACGFSFGYNYNKSGYTRPAMTKTPMIVGHFAVVG